MDCCRPGSLFSLAGPSFLCPPPAAAAPCTIPPPPPRTATANRIRNAFIHAYTGYLTHAFPDDELRPLSLRNHTNLNGWGLTVFDGLDTMWIMGIPELWDHAVEFIAEHQFQMQPKDFAPFFETNIRYLGGMLSAYALSGNPLLLEKADELGASMLPALDTPSGLPAFAVNTKSGLTRPAGVDWRYTEGRSSQLSIGVQISCSPHFQPRTISPRSRISWL